MTLARRVYRYVVGRDVTPVPFKPTSEGIPRSDPTKGGDEFLHPRQFIALDTHDLDSDGLAACPPVPWTLAPGAEPMPGYRLTNWLGRGGSAEVWRAVGPGGFPLALKFVRMGGKDDAVQTRSLELMKEIRHAHLLTLFAAWRRDGLLIGGMELAERTLRDRFDEAVREGLPGIPFPELIEALRQAALGIDFLNEPRHDLPGRKGAGIQHRDIKPQNLFIVSGCVKVGDFGLAKILEESSTTHTGSMTLAYAAPELFQGQISGRSDQYSLAVTYCHLATGVLPFKGCPAAITTGHLFRAPDLSALPCCERKVVARALDKRPESRWPDCVTFVDELMRSHGVKTRNGLGTSPSRSGDATRQTLRSARGPRPGRIIARASGSLAVAGIPLALGALLSFPMARPGPLAPGMAAKASTAPKRSMGLERIARAGNDRATIREAANDRRERDPSRGHPVASARREGPHRDDASPFDERTRAGLGRSSASRDRGGRGRR